MTLLALVGIVITPLVILGLATLLTWVERRLLGVWQNRCGPNRVGPGGVLQAAADGIKILFKEDWTPPFADKGVFVLAPAIGMMTVLLSFAVIPLTFSSSIAAGLNVGLLFVLAMMGLGVYAVVLAGWASNSKFALLGGMRAAAQMISYEVFMGLALMGVVMMTGSFSLRDIVMAQSGLWFVLPQCVGFVVFLLAGIAETHRLPFDLPEGENELGAGFHTEYSGMKFGMFFIAEYAGIVLVSALITTLYLGGWQGPILPAPIWFTLKTTVLIGFFILLRAALPRPRYDQLMALGWKILLPLSLLNIVVTGAVLLLHTAG
ncbi:NADH-quinone oxidoreductase subunit H [Gluconobacter thailandicus F149-1 = NBRC 100600]|uniref:NADH-quinone oxidoreductase subunit H n=1 Tax=Gluconobacter thailandicus NBRC 3257 TaxID=1381097 RepID=A0ABQ0IZI9_GLUTH|nr:NADH-quinone oxidoreductase subunit NuoH [Gluconobacter thailandicus]KXV53547.1 NADH:ubiquinone oxidoreductase [Gluconobacter thailandicus]GAC88446.1 NADH-quinone oxidoreductase subunit H [Gluconobacter thailandicus NBRC 3255]GAD27624.1 NADH-quinone oxidoreductase subunit H [Gluconobacter thailandicus NBRC 3257]GAN91966.1 NADH-quinone oxidoreductase subunit H [Gluconobacter thailandicus F149-1 = NBRC 100600]GBR61667.1 NADH-quinone oxidoreductase chain H [Gluconobacter thailandicus F149-1 = 